MILTPGLSERQLCLARMSVQAKRGSTTSTLRSLAGSRRKKAITFSWCSLRLKRNVLSTAEDRMFLLTQLQRTMRGPKLGSAIGEGAQRLAHTAAGPSRSDSASNALR